MPFKDKKRRKEYMENYYKTNNKYILNQKKEYYSRDAVRKRKAELDKLYRKTPKGRFLHTIASKYISFDDYLKLEELHKDVCAICGKKCSSGKRLSIDHSHKTNKVRGLLCGSCNLGIGKFYDDIGLLEKAIVYLRKYET